MEQVYTPKQNYKVLVRCMTYNQSKYIEDALNGFAMQKTDFPFVCLVMDDASSDGEQGVIKAWMERECDMSQTENVEIEKSIVTIVPHKINPNCSFAFYFLKENLYGTGKKTPLVAPWREHCEYEALCEGDDYWIEKSKLQKQVNFLDSHPEYVVCSHSFYRLFDDGNLVRSRRFPSDFAYSIKEYHTFWPTQPLTTIYRTAAYPSSAEIEKYKYFRDNHLYYLLLQKGSGYFFNDCMGVYRINNNGIWSSLSRMEAVEIDMLCYFELFENYRKDKLLKRKCIDLFSRYFALSLSESKPMKKVNAFHVLGVSGTIIAACLGFCRLIKLWF